MENLPDPGAQRKRRLPSVDTTISEILANPRNFARVRVTGLVVSTDESRRAIMVNDGTGSITIYTGEVVSEKTPVRIIGRPAPLIDGGAELDAEILQVLTGLDVTMLKEVLNLRRRLQAKYDEAHSSSR